VTDAGIVIFTYKSARKKTLTVRHTTHTEAREHQEDKKQRAPTTLSAVVVIGLFVVSYHVVAGVHKAPISAIEISIVSRRFIYSETLHFWCSMLQQDPDGVLQSFGCHYER
jgi:hypothetical protein